MKNENSLSFSSKKTGVVETILYKGKTYFAVYKNNTVTVVEDINIDDQKIKPISSSDDIIKAGLLKLCFKPKEYESNQELYKEIVDFIKKYFYGNDSFIRVSALYVMMSWVFELFREIPYLRVLGGFSTGKSRFLTAVGSCCYKPMFFTGSSSFSSIFRAIHQFKGTLLFDEGDFKSSDFASEATKLFNVGYSKDGCVTRSGERGTKTKHYELEAYNVFCPKIIASREPYDDIALESRCITQELPVITKNNNIVLQIPDEFEKDVSRLKRRLLMFRFKNINNFNIESFDIDGISNMRILQIMAPIWNIAKLLSKKERSLVIDYSIKMDKEISRSQLITDEACVLMSIIKLMKLNMEKIYMNDISRNIREARPIYNGDMYYETVGDLSPRKIGHLVEKNLHLKKHRDNKGLYLKITNSTKVQINDLKNRFGITDEMFN